jgi:hypothetical protein
LIADRCRPANKESEDSQPVCQRVGCAADQRCIERTARVHFLPFHLDRCRRFPSVAVMQINAQLKQADLQTRRSNPG